MSDSSDTPSGGYSLNLIILCLVEILIGTFLIFRIFFTDSFIVGSARFIVVGTLFLVLILGYMILQVPDNTESDITLFTLNLIIIPFAIMACIAIRIIHNNIYGSYSGSMATNVRKPSAEESALLATPPSYKYKTGGGKKKKHVSRKI